MAVTRRGFIKNAAAAAGAAALSAMLPQPAEAAAPKKWDEEADVIVVGFGGAGGSAAIEAHDHKAKVLILEKQPEATHYPNTRMSGGIFHCPDKDGDKEALTQYSRALFSGDNVEGKLEGEMRPELAQALAEAWAEYSPQNFDWLKSLDPEFNAMARGGAAFKTFPGAEASKYRTYTGTYTGKVSYAKPTVNLPKSEKMAGEAVFTCIKEGVKSRKIRVIYEAPASRLITNDKGEVIGVVAVRKGKEINCKAKRAVILTCGGYEYNLPMREAFLEGPGVDGWAFYGTPANTGDGIAMAMAVGAGLAKVGKSAARLIATVPQRYNGLRMGLITDSVGARGSIVVDNFGKRYASENLVTDDPSRYFFYKEAVKMDISNLNYPRIPSWMIFDEAFRTKTTITYKGISVAGFGFIEWDADNANAVKNGWILKGDTIEELAEKINAHPENMKQITAAELKNTIERFNQFCSEGEDKDFGRKPQTMTPLTNPPYYALALYAGGPNTKGGLAVTADRKVVDWLNKPIKRLYSAGEISSALKFVYQSGGNVTECMVFGRIAGKNAAAEKPWA